MAPPGREARPRRPPPGRHRRSGTDRNSRRVDLRGVGKGAERAVPTRRSSIDNGRHASAYALCASAYALRTPADSSPSVARAASEGGSADSNPSVACAASEGGSLCPPYDSSATNFPFGLIFTLNDIV